MLVVIGGIGHLPGAEQDAGLKQVLQFRIREFRDEFGEQLLAFALDAIELQGSFDERRLNKIAQVGRLGGDDGIEIERVVRQAERSFLVGFLSGIEPDEIGVKMFLLELNELAFEIRKRGARGFLKRDGFPQRVHVLFIKSEVFRADEFDRLLRLGLRSARFEISLAASAPLRMFAASSAQATSFVHGPGRSHGSRPGRSARRPRLRARRSESRPAPSASFAERLRSPRRSCAGPRCGRCASWSRTTVGRLSPAFSRAVWIVAKGVTAVWIHSGTLPLRSSRARPAAVVLDAGPGHAPDSESRAGKARTVSGRAIRRSRRARAPSSLFAAIGPHVSFGRRNERGLQGQGFPRAPPQSRRERI